MKPSLNHCRIRLSVVCDVISNQRVMKKFVFLFLLVIMSGASFGQSKQFKKTHKKALKSLTEGRYFEARDLYNSLIEMGTDDPMVYFEAGLAQYNSYEQREASIEHFEKALELSTKDTVPEIVFYTARAHHYAENFEKAIEYYTVFQDFARDNKTGTVLRRDVTRFITMCNNGMDYGSNRESEQKVENVGESVNSAYAEYAPVVKKDESLLIFTARKTGSTGKNIYLDDKYYEDIYVSPKQGEGWEYATKIDSSSQYISDRINTKYHDAAIAFSDDEQKLFIYRENHIWVSEYKDGAWGEPVKMNKRINSKGQEPSAFLSYDEQMLFVVSDRDEGFGGRDIWYTTKDQAGNWNQLRNLGEVVNTRFDEDAPYLMKDGRTLFFSSNGHTTMGGYDVFKTTMKDDSTWTMPENLGRPINSAGDDIYYAPNDEEIWAYYSSSRIGGFGDMDIYRIQLTCENLPNTEIRGTLMAGDSRLPVGGTIKIVDEEGTEYGEFPVDPETGKYVLVLPPEKTYHLELVTKDAWSQKRPHKESFNIPKQCDPFALYQEITLQHLTSETNKTYAQEAHFYNALFNVEDSAKAAFDFETPGEQGPQGDMRMNYTGNVNFNKVLEAPNAEVYLLNENAEIVRFTTTSSDGTFAFNNLDPDQTYMIAFNSEDLKEIYYGLSSNSMENGLFALGHITVDYPSIDTLGGPVDSLNILLIDHDKEIVNATHTSLGNWSIDQIPSNASDIAKMNEDMDIVYDIAEEGMDYAISAYIRTVDEETNTSYTEYIDLIPMDTTGEAGDGNGGKLIAFENIYFDFDRYFLRPKSKQILDNIVAFMKENPTAEIRMDGHCDWFGPDNYNDVLSKNRSVSAYDYLISKGISEDRLGKKWFGESQPAAPNENPDGTDNPDGRQLNRRVEFKITMDGMDLTIAMH